MAPLTMVSSKNQVLNPSTPSKPSQHTAISRVRVIVRLRPFLAREIASKSGHPVPCVSVIQSECGSGEEVSVYLKDQETSRNECYNLDSFFGQEDDSVVKIFQKEVCPLLPGIFHGSNATVFSYGATGSGKTYTMQGTEEQPGLVPQAMSMILSMCQTTGSTVEISYYEVYMDRCYDLLELKAKEIAVLDDKDGQVHLKGLSRVPVNSMSEFYKVFSCGIERRKVAHTGLNEVSSRSHGVLVIAVSTASPYGLGTAITGKLNLIDLAGNEDNRRACNEGIRLQESAKINQSLLALSNVIYALNNNKSRVPYRESKLTRILQDSLGGTSRALMIACLNPGEYQESLHTVSLAARSRHISHFVPSVRKQETPKVKVDMEAKLLAWLESKGKTKSTQRMGAFGSPLFTKTPGSLSSFRKAAPLCLSSVKSKTTRQGDSTRKDRLISMPQSNLFNCEITFDNHSADLFVQKLEDCQCNDSIVPISNNSQLLSSDVSTANRTTLQLGYLPEELMDEEKETTGRTAVSIGSSPCNSITKVYERESPLRKALSPINSNITRTALKETSSREDEACRKTPFVVTRDKFQDFGTPLDKFTVRSSSLKSSLVEEYVDFLNTASREELLELKGIGPKMANYIIELRENDPLESLSDLEKIGLSSKQVQKMFSRAARGIF
ncbi:hypothetical protein Nepgr_024927 [Nepenthes gracilis]|uniref:Kinesin-like protein n=1 Tax=Nepenthes gracilis TaxID=150966 RepID=A0AAD3Y0I4_NEPGR|nr:hypothetical protein Nepgr_024927 [Nepenthes gracilis]